MKEEFCFCDCHKVGDVVRLLFTMEILGDSNKENINEGQSDLSPTPLGQIWKGMFDVN